MSKRIRAKICCVILLFSMILNSLLPVTAAAETNNTQDSVTVKGMVTDNNNVPVADAKVSLSEKTAYTGESGIFTIQDARFGVHKIEIEKAGYQIYSGDVTVKKDGSGSVVLKDLKLEKLKEVEELKEVKELKEVEKKITFSTKTIGSDDMNVIVAEKFPSAVQYVMKKEGNKTFEGQPLKINTVTINNTPIQIAEKDVSSTFDAARATYILNAKNTAEGIDAEITALLEVKDNTLTFHITNVKNRLDNEKYPIQTIEIPNHSLVSVNTAQTGSNLKGARMSTNTTISGDTYMELSSETVENSADFMYAFVSNNELSAGLWSNAEHEGTAAYARVYGGSRNTRVEASISGIPGGIKTVGLASTPWYYQRKITAKGKEYVIPETEMPMAKIIISGDQNNDKKIDWQDGAIAFRDIMNNPYKCEEVPELIAWRIAMNFGGQAQNPFLTTLDNVKRVAQHTDGLGQSVLLKGYGNEGHDSGHPDYADIGTRIGGADDMNIMMEAGREYGARFGIHINASEMYPEAKAFGEDLVRRQENGSLRYGWNWLDQAIGIDALADLAMGLRQSRFDALKEKVGDNMDFVYIDVWGNRTSGLEDSWETRKFTKTIIGNGWRVATEWGSAMEYDSTFQHWATDLTYGGYTLKGINSEVIRFLRNHQKDSWPADYQTYGGVANAPLLGGYNMKDFEGWQGRNDYDAYIENLYKYDLSTKFLQHYKIVKWVNGKEISYPASGRVTEHKWIPDMQITLRDKTGNEVTVTRGSNDVNSPDFRKRTITLNGKVVLDGAIRGNGEYSGVSQSKDTESYLLPWLWDAKDGSDLAFTDQKLYHWNLAGGVTTWELPAEWANLKAVVAYRLTDLGKTEKQTIPVANGKITLTAEAKTPYVIYAGEKDNLDIKWSTGMQIIDAGFNGGMDVLNQVWEKESGTGKGTAVIAKSQYSNPMLKLSGDITLSQPLTGLVPGEKYVVLTGVDNRSDAMAWVTASTEGRVIGSNFTTRSIAKNYVQAYTHSNKSATVDGSSYFQFMYLYFTAPKSGKVTLKLSREAGEGDTYFDDIRIIRDNSKNITRDKNGEIIKFEQDFENSVQGIYPFVIGPIEGVEDNRTHLSEKHAPFTQAGWDIKGMDDVLAGTWSLKTNGLTGRNNLAYQTVPQNFRFEPGERYKVSFDYQSGWDGTYAFVTGNGEFSQKSIVKYPLQAAWGKTRHIEFDVLGEASGQTWIGIYSTGIMPDTSNYNNSQANFSGLKDIVLDNLVIEKRQVDDYRTVLKELLEECEKLDKSQYKPESWKEFEIVLARAQVMADWKHASQQELKNAYMELYAAKAALGQPITNTAEFDTHDITLDKATVTAGSAQKLYGNIEGPAELAVDGDISTYWHTAWNENAVELGKAWFAFAYSEPVTVDGLRYLARPGAANANGKIKDYVIEVSKDNGASWQKALEGTFDTGSTWQKAVFKNAIDGVTNVRLNVKSSTGQSAREVNTFASAAEIRPTCNKTVNGKDGVNTTKLSVLIKAVESLSERDYTSDSWKVLTEALKAAKKILKKSDTSQKELDRAYQMLNSARNQLVLEKEKPIDDDILVLKVPRISKISPAGYKKLKITWSKVNGADGYEIYRSKKKNSGYEKIKTITKTGTTSCQIEKLKTGTAYYFKVRAYATVNGKKVYSEFSKIKSGRPVPKQIKLSSAKNVTKGKITLKWKKSKDLSGYEIYRATKKKGKYIQIKTVSKSKTSYIDGKNLVKGKKYYYKIRAYKKVGKKKVRGAYSEIISVKFRR